MANESHWFEQLEHRARNIRAQSTGFGRYGLIRPPRKDRVAIITDSSAAIPQIVQNLPMAGHLFVVPMPVMVGDQIYPEGSLELDRELPLALAAGTDVRTSRPAPGVFSATYRKVLAAGFNRAIVILISGKLSGTVEAAKLAATESELSVRVVDSHATAMLLGSAVLEGLIRTHHITSRSALTEIMRDQIESGFGYFTVPNLEQLRRGGRIAPLAGFLGQLLQVRPLLGLADGQITMIDRARTEPKVQQFMTAAVAKKSAEIPQRLVVHYYGNEKQAIDYAQTIQHHSVAPIPVLPLPAVLAAHLGLGALAVTGTPDKVLISD